MEPIFLLIAEGVIFSDPFPNEVSPCNFDTCSLRTLGTTSANGQFEIHFHRKESRRKAAIGFDSAELKRNRSPSQIAGAWALILPNDHPEQPSLVRNCRPRTINAAKQTSIHQRRLGRQMRDGCSAFFEQVREYSEYSSRPHAASMLYGTADMMVIVEITKV